MEESAELCPGPAPGIPCGSELAGRAYRCPLCALEAQRRQAAAWRARKRRKRRSLADDLAALRCPECGQVGCEGGEQDCAARRGLEAGA